MHCELLSVGTLSLRFQTIGVLIERRSGGKEGHLHSLDFGNFLLGLTALILVVNRGVQYVHRVMHKSIMVKLEENEKHI